MRSPDRSSVVFALYSNVSWHLAYQMTVEACKVLEAYPGDFGLTFDSVESLDMTRVSDERLSPVYKYSD